MNSTIDWCSIAFAANRRLFRTTRQSWRFNETIQRRTVSLLPLYGHDFRVIVSLVWSSESPTRTGTISTHKFDVLLSNNRRGSTAILTGISPLIQTSLKTSWRPQRPSIDVDDYVMTINFILLLVMHPVCGPESDSRFKHRRSRSRNLKGESDQISNGLSRVSNE